MKLFNWMLGVLLILLGIASYEFSFVAFVAMLLIVSAGVINLPPIAIIIDKKFKTKRSTRNSIVAILVFIAFYLIGLTAQ